MSGYGYVVYPDINCLFLLTRWKTSVILHVIHMHLYSLYYKSYAECEADLTFYRGGLVPKIHNTDGMYIYVVSVVLGRISLISCFSPYFRTHNNSFHSIIPQKCVIVIKIQEYYTAAHRGIF